MPVSFTFPADYSNVPNSEMPGLDMLVFIKFMCTKQADDPLLNEFANLTFKYSP